MNWLAHLRLAPPEPLLRIGNLLGDFVRGMDVATLPEPLRVGIAQHRAIDRRTDAHPAFLRSRARLSPPFRRFGGVLVDVFGDHFLATQWSRFGDGRTLEAFCAEVYADLDTHAALLPPRLSVVAPRLRAHDWLGSYADLDLVDVTLQRMAERLPRPTLLGEGGRELRTHYAGLREDFAELFTDLLAFAAEGFRLRLSCPAGSTARSC